MHRGSSDFHSSDDRLKAIQRAVDEFRAGLDAGEQIDDDAFCRARPELMPDLGIQVRMLRRIRGLDSDGSARVESRLDPVFDDDAIRKFLDENLKRYSIQDAISRGGQGLVYRARQIHTQRDVAVKVLADGVFASKQQLERFMREIELAARLRHPNIVSIHDSGTVQNRPYCVMEFVDGEPIDGYVLLERPDLSARIRLFSKICRAVSYAHQRGVIHRDLKPANIVVDQDGEPRLLDFGLAKDAFSSEVSGAGLSVQGQIIGTLHYLSPEQVRGDPGEIDTRTDIYALGIVFYQVLTGAFPYSVLESYDKARKNILDSNPTPLKALPVAGSHGIDLSRIDSDVEAILRKALEKDKDRRYQSADAMADDFDRYLRGEIVSARADTRFYVLRKTIRRHRIQLAVALCFVALATTAAVVSMAQYYSAVYERDRADEASGLTQSLVNRILTEIDDDVSRLAGGLDARDRIYSGIESDLRTLAAILKDRGGAEYEQARVSLNLGRMAEQIGNREEAIRLFQKADRLAQGAVVQDAKRDALRIEILIALAGVHDEPNPIIDQAIKLATARTDTPEEGASFQLLLSEAHLQRGQRANESGDTRLGADEALRAIDILGDSVPPAAPQIRWMQTSVSANRLAGAILHQIGDCEASKQHFEVAINTLDQRIEERPTDTVARLERMAIHVGMAESARASGDIEEALAHLDPSIRDGEWLCQADPSEYEWVRSLMIAYLHRSQIWRKMDSSKARQALARCEEMLADLRSYSSDDVRLPELDASVLVFRAMLAHDEGNDNQSAEYFRQALGSYLELDANKADNDRARTMIAFCLMRLSQSYRLLDMPGSAFTQVIETLDLRERQLQRDPQSVINQFYFLCARIEIAYHLRDSEDMDTLRFAMVDAQEMELMIGQLVSEDSSRCYRQDFNNALNRAQRVVCSLERRIEKRQTP